MVTVICLPFSTNEQHMYNPVQHMCNRVQPRAAHVQPRAAHVKNVPLCVAQNLNVKVVLQ